MIGRYLEVDGGKSVMRNRVACDGEVGNGEGLSQYQPLQLHSAGADVGKVVLRLLHKPAFRAAAKHPGQSHGHFRRYTALLVHQFRKRGARDSQGGGGGRNAQAQRLNALSEYKASGVGWVLHRHGKAEIIFRRPRGDGQRG